MKEVCCGSSIKCDDCPELVLQGTVTGTDRTAVADRREQVSGFHRPEVLSDVSVKDAVSEVREIEDLWKVYVPEWIIVASSDANGTDGLAEMEKVVAEKYHDRVRPEDARVVPISTRYPDDWPYRLELKLPNQRGEFKRRDLAEAYAEKMGWLLQPGTSIVPRNSKAEFQIKDYGKKKLPGRVGS